METCKVTLQAMEDQHLAFTQVDYHLPKITKSRWGIQQSLSTLSSSGQEEHIIQKGGWRLKLEEDNHLQAKYTLAWTYLINIDSK